MKNLEKFRLIMTICRWKLNKLKENKKRIKKKNYNNKMIMKNNKSKKMLLTNLEMKKMQRIKNNNNKIRKRVIWILIILLRKGMKIIWI